MKAPEIPYYSLEKPREDAAGLWTARIELDIPRPREEILRYIGEYAIATQNIHALMTGYIEGDADVRHGSAIIFTRDPHPEEEYITLSPDEYEGLAEDFAEHYGMRKVPYTIDNEFRVILGRVPGYSRDDARPMHEVEQLLSPGHLSLSIQEGYFFSVRYQDEDRWWDEHAAVIYGSLRDAPAVGRAGYELRQHRFVCETHEHTLVYNMTDTDNYTKAA